MHSLENTTQHPIQLPTGHVIPRLGSIIVDDQVLTHCDNAPSIGPMIWRGNLIATAVADQDMTRADVEMMNKTELIGMLRIHKAKTAGSNNDLRGRLIDILFAKDLPVDGPIEDG